MNHPCSNILSDLKKHNERPWFKANKARYEDELRSPMLHFIENFVPHLEKISEAIVAEPKRWKRISTAKALKTADCTLVGDSLKRPPRGFDPEHPLIEDLKRKDFILAANTSEENALSTDFIKQFAKFCKTAAPVNEFITRALDLEW